MAHPRTMAKPATWSVRLSSVRLTWRTFASRGDIASCLRYDGGLVTSMVLGLLDAGDPLQGRDPLLDRRVGVEKVIERSSVMLCRVVDHHGRHGMVELLRWLVVLRD